jgi:glycosyltransferase involved in cell wall biosynthesis
MTAHPAFGLSLIVRDAARTIHRAVEPFLGVADEIVVADTGSRDETVAILEALGARIVRTEWKDDFAAARNVALDAGRADWVFSLDADEWVTREDAAALKALTARREADAYVIETINYVRYSDPTTTFPTTGAEAAIAPHFFLSSKVRLFRRFLGNREDSAARWQGRVHELVDFSAASAGYRIARANVRIRHDGLLEGRSAERYLALARAALESGDAHPGIVTTLGMDAVKKGRTDKGERLLRRAIAMEPRYPAPAVWLARLLHATARSDEAVALLLEALQKTAGAPEILSVLIEIYDARGETAHAKTMRDLAARMHPGHPALGRAGPRTP